MYEHARKYCTVDVVHKRIASKTLHHTKSLWVNKKFIQKAFRFIGNYFIRSNLQNQEPFCLYPSVVAYACVQCWRTPSTYQLAQFAMLFYPAMIFYRLLFWCDGRRKGDTLYIHASDFFPGHASCMHAHIGTTCPGVSLFTFFPFFPPSSCPFHPSFSLFSCSLSPARPARRNRLHECSTGYDKDIINARQWNK